MEQGAFLALELILAQAAISIAATVRFLFWVRKRAKQSMVDFGLLLLQLVFFVFSGPAMAADLFRNSGDIIVFMQGAVVILPLTAACFAQIAMFMNMRVGSKS